MKRLGTLVMAILLITVCNAIQPNMEETELLWAVTEKNIQKWAITTKAEASPAEKPRNTPEPTVEIPQKTPELAEKPAPQTPAPTPSPEPPTNEHESQFQPEPPTPQQTEQPEEIPVLINWPYPAITCLPEPELPQITCPPEPEPTPGIDWPYITAPEPSTYTPEPEPMEPPREQPTTTPVPVVPDTPIAPAPEPTEPPTDPTPEPTVEPQTGYAECSCGARLPPEEVLPHMKAHAMSGENHSYRAY